MHDSRRHSQTYGGNGCIRVAGTRHRPQLAAASGAAAGDRKRLIIKIAVVALTTVAGFYLIALCLLAVWQRALIYPAAGSGPQAFVAAAPGFGDVALRTSDGLQLKALHKPARAGLPSLIFFHGNGDSLRGALAATGALAVAGYGLLLPEYRGYGGNPGHPSEAGLYRDGEAALQWLRHEGAPLDDVVLVGNSLGSGVATELAARYPVGGVVLVSGFTSLADVAAAQMRIFPVRLLLKDRYENLAKLPGVSAPVLVLHGTADTLIPATHGAALARAARRSTLLLVPGAGHELAFLPQSQAAIGQWLEARRTE